MYELAAVETPASELAAVETLASELAAVETLASELYLARLDNPTPWSVRMMPHHRNMVRSPDPPFRSTTCGTR